MADTKTTLALLSRRAKSGFVTVADAGHVLGLTKTQASRRLGELTRAGWLTRARRGLFYIRPLEAMPDGRPVAPDPWLLASVLFDPSYIGGWSAAEHWGLTEQLFRSTFVVTARHIRSTAHSVLGLEFRVVRIRDSARIDSVDTLWRGAEKVRVSSAERTIVDGLNEPSWLGGFRHLVDVLTNYGHAPDRDFDRLADELRCVGRGAAHKRMGFLAERLWPDRDELVQLAAEGRSKGNINLDPALPRRGKLNSRWGLWVNTEVSSLN